MLGGGRDEAETQRQIKSTKTLPIVPLLQVTNRQVKRTPCVVEMYSPLSLLPPPSLTLSLYSLDSL